MSCRRFLLPVVFVVALHSAAVAAAASVTPAELPQPASQPAPVYPYALRQEGRGGLVLLSYVVTVKGRVADPFSI